MTKCKQFNFVSDLARNGLPKKAHKHIQDLTRVVISYEIY